jgi:hypothetical protein
MANQSTPAGASGVAAAASETISQAAENMSKASSIAEKFFEQSLAATGKQAEALNLMAMNYDKIAKQNAELLKINKELQALDLKRVETKKEEEKLQRKLADLADKDDAVSKAKKTKLEQQLAIKKQEYEQTRQDLALKRNAAIEAERAANSQMKAIEQMGKTQGIVGKMFELGKSQMGQYVAGVISVAAAVRNLAKLSQDVLDVSVLSGNYAALNTGTLGLVASAAKFQMGMAEARIGLRFLGFSAEEVNASYKELSQTVSGFDGSLAKAEETGKLTETTGRLARVLGVSLPEATQYMIDMSQKFNATQGQTAAAMYDIYDKAKKYNNAGAGTVMITRDITKVMFDLARESKGAAVDQQFLADKLTSNVLGLQAQGRNYKEALGQAALYVKKMSTEAPPWAKIFAGRELEKQMAGVTEAGTDAMSKKLEEARPGLSKRIFDIMSSGDDPIMKQRLLQEALEGTSIGFNAMEKVVGDLVDRLGPKAKIALQQMYGVTATEADSMVKQLEVSRLLEKSKEKNFDFDKMSAAEKSKMTSKTGLSVDQLKSLSLIHDVEKRNIALKVMLEKKAIDDIKAHKVAADKAREKQLKEYEAARAEALASGDTDVAESFQKKIDALKGPETTNTKLEADMKAVQGGDVGKGIALLIEILKNPMVELVAGMAVLGLQLAVQMGILAEMGGLKDLADFTKNLFKGKKGGGSGGKGKSVAQAEAAYKAAPAASAEKAAARAELATAKAAEKAEKATVKAAEKAAEKAGLAGLAQTAERTAEATTKIAKPGLLGKAAGKATSAMGAVSRGASGVMGTVGKSAIGKMGGALAGGSGKLLKALKIGKAIPILGSLVSAGFLAKDIWNIASSVMGGEGIKPSDLASLGLNAAGLVPGLGTIAAVADIGLSASGAYAGMDKAVGPLGASMQGVPISGLPEGSVAGAGGGGAGGLPAGVAPPGGGAEGGGTNRITFQATPLVGAQGVDVEFIGKIPFAQLMAMNLAIANKASRGPMG